MSLAAVIERSQTDREGWKYTSLAPMAKQAFVPALPAQAPKNLPSIVAVAGERHQIVFVNGVWQPEHSRLGELDGILKGDPKTGYRFTLAGQTCLVTAPVELVFVTDAGNTAAEINLRLTIDLGTSGRLTLIEHHVKATGSVPAAAVYETDIMLGPQAKLVHGKIVDGGEMLSMFAQTRVDIAEGGYYDNFILTTSGKLVRNEIDATLAGKLAQCTLNGTMLVRGTNHADTTTHIRHAVPFGNSSQVYKSVVDGKAHAVFQGKITVAEHAQKTDAQQVSRALLLSDQAEVDAKPELRIFADDVKCSHGSTVGALDEDALFYLRARGLNEQAARGLLIRAFANDIIDEIQMPEWRDYCRTKAEEWCDAAE